jgi:hypothetical protein
MTVFTQFSKQFCKVMQQFGSGLQKCSEILSKELNSQNSFDTTTIAFSNIKMGLDKLVHQSNQKAQMIIAEILEPLEHHQKSFQAMTSEQITQAKAIWSELEEHRQRLETQQDRYYRLSSDAE